MTNSRSKSGLIEDEYYTGELNKAGFSHGEGKYKGNYQDIEVLKEGIFYNSGQAGLGK